MNDKIIQLSDGSYLVEVYRGMEAPGIDFFGEASKALGVDILNNPNYVISSDGANDDNGISESIYSEVVVYRKFEMAIPPIEEIEEEEIDPIDDPEEKDDNNPKKKVQDMLDKYYGNSKKRKEYKKRYKRFISHIVERDGYSFVEDYPEKKEDEQFLQLQEYSYRLERFSKAAKGDFSMYHEAIELYRLTGTMPRDEEGKEIPEDKLITLLRLEDQEYISTNNYAYNQHKTSQETLKTLGKHGEKVSYYQLQEVFSEEKKDGKDKKKFHAKAFAHNIIPALANAGLFVRNWTKRPLYALAGKGIAAVHRVIYDSKKSVSGVYKNLRTHRYNARKDYFEQMYDLKFFLENEKRKEEGKKEKKPRSLRNSIKKAFIPRFQAIFRRKEGNVIVETTKAYEIEKSCEARTKVLQQQKRIHKALTKRKKKLLLDLKEVTEEIEKTQDQELLDALLVVKAELEKTIKDIEHKIELNKNRPIPGIIQTDPISMAQHEKANRENVTKTVSTITGIARVAAVRYLGPKIVKVIKEQIFKQKVIPGYDIEFKEWVDGKVSKKDLKDVTIKDMYDKSQPTVSYHAGGGSTVAAPRGKINYRGIDFDYNGENISGTDGIGYNWRKGPTGIPYSDCQISPMSGDSKFFDVVAETISKKSGKKITGDDLINQIVNSPDPQKTLDELAGNVKLWVSPSASGVAQGWADTDSGLKAIIEAASEGYFKKGIKHVPERTINILTEVSRTIVDPRILMAIIAVGMDGVVDVYDLLRRTKSKEEMQKEGTHRGPVKAVQKENNKPYTERNTSNKWRFQGTKKADYESLYDEEDFGGYTPGGRSR